MILSRNCARLYLETMAEDLVEVVYLRRVAKLIHHVVGDVDDVRDRAGHLDGKPLPHARSRDERPKHGVESATDGDVQRSADEIAKFASTLIGQSTTSRSQKSGNRSLPVYPRLELHTFKPMPNSS